MSEIVANCSAHLPQYVTHGGFAQCSLIRNQQDGNTVHELEKGNHLIFNSDRLSPMCVLTLNERAKVLNQYVKCPSPHMQDIIKHVRSVDIK